VGAGGEGGLFAPGPVGLGVLALGLLADTRVTGQCAGHLLAGDRARVGVRVLQEGVAVGEGCLGGERPGPAVDVEALCEFGAQVLVGERVQTCQARIGVVVPAVRGGHGHVFAPWDPRPVPTRWAMWLGPTGVFVVPFNDSVLRIGWTLIEGGVILSTSARGSHQETL